MMELEFQALLVRAIAPAHLADAIVGDLYEQRATLAQTLRSLASLATYRASQSFADNWIVALPVATIICALCIVTIPFWNRLGMGGGIYHVLRLAFIGLILGCIPRASTLGFWFLLVLIGISDSLIDARQLQIGWQVLTYANLYQGLLLDAAAMAVALAALHLTPSLRRKTRG